MPGPLQTFQRAEIWEVILEDNLNVVRQVGRLLDGVECPRPAELVTDGELITPLCKKIDRRCRDTFRVAEVKGHADDDTMQIGGYGN